MLPASYRLGGPDLLYLAFFRHDMTRQVLIFKFLYFFLFLSIILRLLLQYTLRSVLNPYY